MTNMVGDIERVRRRPAMWIGDTGVQGLHQLLWFVIGAHLNRHLSGASDHITVRLDSDGSVTVESNDIGNTNESRILPSVLQNRLTTVGATCETSRNSYRAAGIWDDEFLYATNALSSRLVAEVHSSDLYYRQEYKMGILVFSRRGTGNGNIGVTTTFWPDDTIFDALAFDIDLVAEQARSTCYLNPNLTINVVDARTMTADSHTFHFAHGLVSCVDRLDENQDLLTPTIAIVRSVGTTKIDIALRYVSGNRERVLSFANNYRTVDGGEHQRGFSIALAQSMNEFARNEGLLTNGAMSESIISAGLTAVISIWLLEPQFENAIKAVLTNKAVRAQVGMVVTEGVVAHFQTAPDLWKRLIERLQVTHS